MKLSALTLETSGNRVVMSWKADNRALQLTFSGTERSLPAAADAAFASCLMPAMLLGEELTVDESFNVSKALLSNLAQFQQYFVSWFDDLQWVNILIPEQQLHDNAVAPSDNAVFYSGGVDASYSFFELKNNINHLIFCLGLDIQLGEHERCEKALSAAQQFALHYDKNLIVMETNFRDAFPELSAKRCQIVLLISYSLALGLCNLYVPASHDARELEPFITHPLTDPLLSNALTNVIHHGMISRMKKTAAIANSDQALNYLRVCNASSQFNCGECEKCLRTMAALATLDKQSAALPVLAPKKLRAVQIWTPGIYHMWQDIYDSAVQNNKAGLAKEVAKLCKAYDRKQLLKQIKKQIAVIITDLKLRLLNSK